MCPVIVRSAAFPPACASSMPYCFLERCDVSLREPDRDLDRNGDAVVGQHEPLQCLVTQLVVANRWNDESCAMRVAAFSLRFTMIREMSAKSREPLNNSSNMAH